MLTSPIHAGKFTMIFHDILTICSKVKSNLMMQGVGLSFPRLSLVWDLSRPLEHTGDTAGTVGAVVPQGTPNYAASIGFHCSPDCHSPRP